MRLYKSILTAATVAGLAGGMAFAQAQAPAAQTGQGRPRVEARRQMRKKLLTGYLGLTEPQQVKAKAIFANARESAMPLRQELRETRGEMRAAIQAGKPVDPIASKEGKLLGQLASVRANSAEQFRALLTPQQLQKLQQLHAGNGAWRARKAQRG